MRGEDGERELVMMRWGMPGPPQFGGVPVTNIRNTKSPHWRRWLGPAARCIVLTTSFREWEETKPKKTPTWFALDENRPLFAFAGPGCARPGPKPPRCNGPCPTINCKSSCAGIGPRRRERFASHRERQVLYRYVGYRLRSRRLHNEAVNLIIAKITKKMPLRIAAPTAI